MARIESWDSQLPIRFEIVSKDANAKKIRPVSVETIFVDKIVQPHGHQKNTQIPPPFPNYDLFKFPLPLIIFIYLGEL